MYTFSDSLSPGFCFVRMHRICARTVGTSLVVTWWVCPLLVVQEFISFTRLRPCYLINSQHVPPQPNKKRNCFEQTCLPNSTSELQLAVLCELTSLSKKRKEGQNKINVCAVERNPWHFECVLWCLFDLGSESLFECVQFSSQVISWALGPSFFTPPCLAPLPPFGASVNAFVHLELILSSLPDSCIHICICIYIYIYMYIYICT